MGGEIAEGQAHQSASQRVIIQFAETVDGDEHDVLVVGDEEVVAVDGADVVGYSLLEELVGGTVSGAAGFKLDWHVSVLLGNGWVPAVGDELPVT